VIGQENARFPAPSLPSVGLVRGLPHTWEADDLTGQALSTNPAAQWNKGQILRRYQPTVHIGPDLPVHDASDPTTQAGWTRATS
jgi:hypothetical protein